MPDQIDSFVASFLSADLEGARAVLAECLGQLPVEGYGGHPLLRRCVSENGGHCHRRGPLQIAELLIPEAVCQLRDVLISGSVEELQRLLSGGKSIAS